MEFTDDTEIAELLDLGTSVIQELQRAELKGPQTTGKPKVPPGNTRSLATLWEKESETRTEPEALPTEHANPDMSPASHNDPAKAAHEGAAEEGEADPEPDKAAGSDLTNSRPGDDLDKALAKLESRAKQNRTQQLIVKKGEGGNQSIPFYPTNEPPGGGINHSEQTRPNDRANTRSWKPGHRREYSFACRDGRLEVISWCNPICTPIRAEPRREVCKCGKCPISCILCCQSQ
uniref:V protein n=1 Tax=avian paramyxovirus 2 TaxID=2560313 RepID=D9ZNM7_9MONO|nr:V protein [Avian metaavulavirus 2]